jgi:hypothetical protein
MNSTWRTEVVLLADYLLVGQLSLAKTRLPLVSTAWEMGCNVAEPGYRRPRRGILELDDILAKNRDKWHIVRWFHSIFYVSQTAEKQKQNPTFPR